MTHASRASAASRHAGESLWSRWKERGDLEARRLLLDSHLGLVHQAARELARHCSPSIALDDLIGSGTLGLVHALEGFDPGRGLTFSTYAMPRIRGAMLDELRSYDWRSRVARTHARDIEKARRALEQKLGRGPTPEEIAEALTIDMDTYWRWNRDTGPAAMLELDRPSAGTEESLLDSLADPAGVPQDEALAADQTRIALAAAFCGLPEKDRTILSMYFFEGLTLKQIGVVWHVTESRVSQIRTRALRMLKEAIEREE